jgi:hypothetical protein
VTRQDSSNTDGPELAGDSIEHHLLKLPAPLGGGGYGFAGPLALHVPRRLRLPPFHSNEMTE